MATTTNYGLYLNDDSSETFLSWRNKINGTEDSNMLIIDEALASMDSGKADVSTTVTATLSASSWAGTVAPFSQSISIDNLTADTNGLISVAQGASTEAREAAREAMLSVYGQSDGVLTIYADGEMPETDIPVTIILLG